jgi:serine protease inhibitor
MVALARSNKARLEAPPAEAAAAARAVNALGVDLYARFAADRRVNLAFSPASIAIALAMARAGAAGSTAREMDAVLHVEDATALPRSMNALSAGLDERSNTLRSKGGELSIVNSLWGQEGFPFELGFLDLLAAEYGAGLRLVDYRDNPEAARALINAWVEDATRGRISELLPPGSIGEITRLTLVNAVYLKASWLVKFSKHATRQAPFTTSSGTAVKVPTMRVTRYFGYARGDGWQAVELPYQGRELSMLIVLPDEGVSLADAVAAAADAPRMREAEVAVALPRFDFETTANLSAALKALGMATAFDPRKADFSGMSKGPGEPFFVGAVLHQASITVDESGTEAAAATAVTMGAGSALAPPKPIPFVVDRPFVFALRDRPTGAILFLGHVGDPTQGKGRATDSSRPRALDPLSD